MGQSPYTDTVTHKVSYCTAMALSVDQGLFECYAFYAGVILAKMVVMSLLTARQRFRTFTFISSEDIAGYEDKGFTTGKNEDLENILPFLILGLLYIFTNPDLATATLVFRIFVGSRIAHTVVYLLVVPQPARALAFFGGIGVNFYLVYKVITAFA